MLAERFARVAVVGTGMMGPGIALTLSRGGCLVALYGRTEASKDRGLARVDGALAFLVEHGVLEAWEAPALRPGVAAHIGHLRLAHLRYRGRSGATRADGHSALLESAAPGAARGDHSGRADGRGDGRRAGGPDAALRHGSGGGAPGRAGADRQPVAARLAPRGAVHGAGGHCQRRRRRPGLEDGPGTPLARLRRAGAPGRGWSGPDPRRAARAGAYAVQLPGAVAAARRHDQARRAGGQSGPRLLRLGRARCGRGQGTARRLSVRAGTGLGRRA